MSKVSVSVIIPFHNRARFLRESIQSVLDENIEGLQIIAVDDGSTDESIHTIDDLPILIKSVQTRRGASCARNIALSHARGRYIAFFDSDDILTKNGMRWRLNMLDSTPAYSAVAGLPEAAIDDSGNNLASKRIANAWATMKNPDTISAAPNSASLFALIFPLISTLFTRTLINKIGEFDESLPHAQDLDYCYRALKHAPIIYSPKPVFRYRIHENNSSGRWIDDDLKFSKRAMAYAHLISLSHTSDLELHSPAHSAAERDA